MLIKLHQFIDTVYYSITDYFSSRKECEKLLNESDETLKLYITKLYFWRDSDERLVYFIDIFMHIPCLTYLKYSHRFMPEYKIMENIYSYKEVIQMQLKVSLQHIEYQDTSVSVMSNRISYIDCCRFQHFYDDVMNYICTCLAHKGCVEKIGLYKKLDYLLEKYPLKLKKVVD